MSIVTLKNVFRLRNKGSKLLPLFVSHYLVKRRTGSSALLLPLNEVDLETYLQLNNSDRIDQKSKNDQLLIKVDITQVKWVILMILFNTPGNEINYTWLQNLEPNYSTPIIH